MSPDAPTLYDLYHSPYSICSLMVRLTIALGKTTTPHDPAVFLAHYIDIGNEDQLTPGFLSVNPKGQIPALDSCALPTPLTDSVDITRYLCERLYPALEPGEHAEEIWRLVGELHGIQYLSLSVKPENAKREKTGGITEGIERRLKQSGLVGGYRRQLEFKREYHERTLVHALEPELIRKAEDQTRRFFQSLNELRATLGATGAPDEYILGAQPTALDAHTIVFLARLFDVERRDLVPGEWQRYGEKHLLDGPWLGVADSKPTWPGKMSFWMRELGA